MKWRYRSPGRVTTEILSCFRICRIDDLSLKLRFIFGSKKKLRNQGVCKIVLHVILPKGHTV